MLARRDLSEAQVRQRLARHGLEQTDIDDAIGKLKTEGAIDDTRAAHAIVRMQQLVKGRGRMRVKRELQSAGIADDDAARALEDVAGDVDEDALIDAAITRRLRHRSPNIDDSDVQRLYRYLVGQGFDHERILRALKSRRPS